MSEPRTRATLVQKKIIDAYLSKVLVVEHRGETKRTTHVSYITTPTTVDTEGFSDLDDGVVAAILNKRHHDRTASDDEGSKDWHLTGGMVAGVRRKLHGSRRGEPTPKPPAKPVEVLTVLDAKLVDLASAIDRLRVVDIAAVVARLDQQARALRFLAHKAGVDDTGITEALLRAFERDRNEAALRAQQRGGNGTM